MYVVANRVSVASGWEERFEERFRLRAGEVDKQPGFVRMQVLKPAATGAPYVVETVWRSKAAFEEWVGSDDFRQAHRNPLPKEAYQGPGQMEQYEVVVSAEAEGL